MHAVSHPRLPHPFTPLHSPRAHGKARARPTRPIRSLQRPGPTRNHVVLCVCSLGRRLRGLDRHGKGLHLESKSGFVAACPSPAPRLPLACPSPALRLPLARPSPAPSLPFLPLCPSRSRLVPLHARVAQLRLLLAAPVNTLSPVNLGRRVTSPTGTWTVTGWAEARTTTRPRPAPSSTPPCPSPPMLLCVVCPGPCRVVF